MARRLGRGIAVLIVVGLCLPFLLWLFAEREESPLDSASARTPLSAEGRRLATPPPAAPPSLGEPLRQPLGPERPPNPPEPSLAGEEGKLEWADDQVWTGQAEVVVNVARVHTATYSGRVVDPNGQGVAKVRVGGVVGNILSGWNTGDVVDSHQIGPSVTTDAEGRFTFKVRSIVTFPTHLQLTPPKESDLVARQHDLGGLGNGALVDLGDLKLVQGGRVEGRVSGPGGVGLAKVGVRIQQGSLELDRATSGTNILIQSSSFGSSIPLEVGNDNIVEWAGHDFSSSHLDLSFNSVRNGGSARGLSFSGSEAALPNAVSRADGTYTIHGVTPGRYTVVALLRPYTVARFDGVRVRPGLPTRGVNLALALGPVLEVHVRDQEGRPIEGASISGTDGEGLAFGIKTNAEGIAVSEPLTTRRVDLYVDAPGQRGQSSQIQLPVGVTRHKTQVTLRPAGRLRFTAAGPGSAFAIRQGTLEWVQPSQDGDTYTFDLMQPGRYDLLFSNGQELFVAARDVVVRGEGLVDLGALHPVRVEPLRVRVLDAAGRPLGGASLVCQGSYTGSTATGEEGEGQLVLYPGKHSCLVQRHGYADATFTLEGSGAQTVRLPAASSSLTLRLKANLPRVDHSLVLRREGAIVHTATFQSELRVPLGAAGRYSIEIDGYATGYAEVPAGAEAVFQAQPPTKLQLDLTVLGVSGGPARGAEVRVGTQDPRPGTGAALAFGGVEAAMVHTNDQGLAEVQFLRGAVAREVFVRVVAEGQESVFRVPIAEGNRLAQTLRLEAGSGASLEVDAGGIGKAGAVVELKPLTALSAVNQLATLDERGRVVFAGVRPGRYRVTLLAEDRATSAASAEVEVDAAGAQVTLQSS